MASAWIDNGPVSSPPPSVALGVGAALVILAFVGVSLGLHAAWRQGGAPELADATESVDTADTLTAKPIVDLPAAASNTADNAVVQDADNSGNSDAIEAKTAEAQQVQSTASKSGADIDQILASPSEKPTVPAKPTAVEAPPPPGPPVKSDVPF